MKALECQYLLNAAAQDREAATDIDWIAVRATTGSRTDPAELGKYNSRDLAISQGIVLNWIFYKFYFVTSNITKKMTPPDAEKAISRFRKYEKLVAGSMKTGDSLEDWARMQDKVAVLARDKLFSFK
ncbi:hypothetical protein HYW76_04540 [Candidatus Pacearchaeota archaeon]|nr:hypothetical protein [Candidatus Pacearchaeota archaeon]